jgi:nucleoside 2-deoxyribosyltransferase
MRVYLAGPISGKTFDESEGWRDYARRMLHLTGTGIEAYSPMRAKEYLRDEGTIDPFVQSPEVMSTPSGITTRDRWDCTRADVVLANFADSGDRVSIGTCIELGWADISRVPVVGVLPEDNVHNHPMVWELVGFRVPTLDEAIEVIVAMSSES